MFCISVLFGLSLSFQRSIALEGQYQYHQTARCCDNIDNENALMSCLERVDYGTKDIAILSYASSDIMDYATYAFGINSAYAEQNGYEMYFLNEAGGANHEPRDARWNRVKILEEALHAEDGWLNTVDYVVWMDADLIVLDMDMNLREIIAQHSDSDIIISSERHAETGVANTGCFIMKNSAWSRAFLHEWWTRYDRSEAHDQIFFDKLYKSKLPGITQHVTILPQDALNSSPPPMLWQQDHNQVLHMMGQPARIRQEAFMAGFDEVCSAYSEQRALVPQLGLSQPRLLNMASEFHEGYIRDRLIALNASMGGEGERVSESKRLSSEQFFHALDGMRESTIQLGIFGGADVLVYIRSMGKVIKRRLAEEKLSVPLDKYAMLALHNFAAVNGNDLSNHIRDPEEKLRVFDEVEDSINQMLGIIHPETKHVAQELQIRHYISRGEFHLSLAEVQKTQESYLRAEGLFEDPGTNVKNMVILMDIKMGLATSFCMSADPPTVHRGLRYFEEALELQEGFLAAEQHMKEDHIKLALTYLRNSGCLAKSGQFERSLEMLDKSVAICEVHPNRATADAYLDHSHKLRHSLSASLAELKLSGTSQQQQQKEESASVGSSLSGADGTTPAPKKKMMRRKKKRSTPDL